MSKLLKTKEIEVYIHSFQHLYGNYYMPENAHLDNVLLNHLILLASDTKMNEKLEIGIWQKEEGYHKKFNEALINSLTDLIKAVKKEIRDNTLVAAVSLIIGIIVGLVSTRLSIDNEQLSSVFLIAFWVFIWYSIETYMFDNFKLILKIRRYRQVMGATINFYFIESEKNENSTIYE